MPTGPFDAVIFTSETAVAAAAGLQGLPRVAFTVGDRTAAAAKAAGFVTHSASGDAEALVRDLADHITALPREQIVKAQTLGASSWQLAVRVALPQALPRLIAGLRLSLGPAWVYLISAEAIASDIGLGYRIFLVRRYLAMDIIIPYVAWISLLAIVMDVALNQLSRRAFGWAHQADR